MWLEICVAGFVLACFLIAAFMLSRPRNPVSIDKRIVDGNIHIRAKIHRDIKHLEVRIKNNEDPAGIAEYSVVRNNLKKWEVVEFVLPFSNELLKIVYEDMQGTHELSA